MSDVFNSINSKVAFTNPPVVAENKSVTVSDAIAASKVSKNTANDTVEISNKKPERKGLFKSVNQGIANFKKFFATAGAYTTGAFKGLFKGAVAGSLVFGGAHAVNGIRKIQPNIAIKSKKATEETIKLATEKLTKLNKNNKLIAAAGIAAGVITLGTTFWKSMLDLNEKKSDIDHRWTGHKQ